MEKADKKKDSLGKFDNLDFDSIECSTSVFKRLAWEDYRQISIAVIIGAIALSMFFISIVFFDPIFLLVGGVLAYFGFLSNKAQGLFMKEFANRNDLSYEPSIPVDDVTGNLFKFGNSKKITHVLTGSYRDQKARLFYYTYSALHGKNRKNYRFTVIEIFFEKTDFPYILLQAKKGRGMIARRHGKKGENERRIRLEEEFDKNYNLFARDGYGVEVMQIFNEDFLRFLQEENSNFSIELKGNRIYIYDDVLVKKKNQLRELFEVTGKLFERIGPLLNRLENDFAALHGYYKK